MWKFNLAFFRHRLFLRIFWQGCIAAQQLPAWTELEHLFFSLFELKYLFFFLVSYWYCCQKQKQKRINNLLFLLFVFDFEQKNIFVFLTSSRCPATGDFVKKNSRSPVFFFSRKKKISMLYKSFWFYIFSWISVG